MGYSYITLSGSRNSPIKSGLWLLLIPSLSTKIPWKHWMTSKMRLEVHSIDENILLIVETDASNTAVAATLNHTGRLVAFFSHTLTSTERKHASVEKEACAIVEVIKKWSHYLSALRFTIVTDQQAVHYMFHSEKLGKIWTIRSKDGGWNWALWLWHNVLHR